MNWGESLHKKKVTCWSSCFPSSGQNHRKNGSCKYVECSYVSAWVVIRYTANKGRIKEAVQFTYNTVMLRSDEYLIIICYICIAIRNSRYIYALYSMVYGLCISNASWVVGWRGEETRAKASSIFFASTPSGIHKGGELYYQQYRLDLPLILYVP